MCAHVLRAILVTWFLALASRGYAAMKIYISADMEGIGGVVTGNQLGPEGFEYQRAREWMTEEVVAAVEAVRQAGAAEVVVSDSHGNGENLLIEKLPKDVHIIRSWPRPLGMMEGIDETFDAALFIGYHASTHNKKGVRAHTISSARFTDVRINGRSMPEAGINAAIAGHFDVPMVMISGDDAIIEEARALVGDLEGAVVKWAVSFHSARVMTPQAAQEAVAAAVKRALGRLADFKPYRVETPVQLEVSFKNYRPPQLLEFLPFVERTDSHTVHFTGRDIIEVSKFLEFVSGYSAALEP